VPIKTEDGVEVHAYNPSTWELRQEDLMVEASLDI
jgi:hypothetical protein